MERDNRPTGRRCRGAIVRGREVLLLQHQHRGYESTYWWFPGGGCKPGESDTACVVREVKEEVGLDVQVGRSLDLPGDWRGGNHAVYLCTPLPGEVRLGAEEGNRDLVGFTWCPIDDESTWEPEFYEDHIYPILEAVRRMVSATTIYPNYPHKHAEKAYIPPEQVFEMALARAEGPLPPPPEAAILCYQGSLWEAICADDEGTTQGMFGMRLLKKADQRIGVTGGFGIGAPAACLKLESLIAYGVKRFVSIGTAGALQEGLDIGDFVVCDRAIRDEGTSYHYLPASKHAHASPEMVAHLTQAVEKLDLAYRLGTSWTIDAPYRETVAEIRRYQREGVATVEMEASALFALAACRGVEMGAMFAISDSLAGPKWDPHFGSEQVRQALHTLYQAAVESLRASLTR